jgi:hypothetical protein
VDRDGDGPVVVLFHKTKKKKNIINTKMRSSEKQRRTRTTSTAAPAATWFGFFLPSCGRPALQQVGANDDYNNQISNNQKYPSNTNVHVV